MPTKRLGAVGTHGEQDEGVDKLQVSPDRTMLVSLAGMACSLKIWPLEDIMAGIPLLRADNIQKRKQIVKEGYVLVALFKNFPKCRFFDDLSGKKKKRVTDSDEEGDEDESDDGEEDSEDFDDEEGEESDDEESDDG